MQSLRLLKFMACPHNNQAARCCSAVACTAQEADIQAAQLNLGSIILLDANQPSKPSHFDQLTAV